MLKKFLIGAALLASIPAFAKTVTVDARRVVRITGPISGNGIGIASEIEELASASTKPIHIIINSPGGSVATGSQILSSIEMAKNRGITVKCYVPVLAASMGFQVLVHCSERYALKYALLLFHPMKMSSNSPMTKEDLLYNSQRLREWEQPFIDDLLKALDISTEIFMYNYRNETLWMGFEFQTLSPKFLTIVDDIKGVNGLFSL